MLPKPASIELLNALCGGPRAAVLLITKCTRALIHAHFDAAEEQKPGTGKKYFYGATPVFLAARLNEEGVLEDDWNAYKEIWRTLSKGIRLGETADAITIYGKRSRRGAYTSGYPGVFAIVEALLGETIPQPLLKDWYRAELCARYQMDDSQEFIVFAEEWIDRFNNINARRKKRKELTALITVAEIPHKGEWAEGLIEVFDFLALVNLDLTDLFSYGLKFKADPAFVLTNLFGRSTGIEGLDYLLYGGLWIPTQEKMSLVVSGAPGIGKSTLALALSTQVAARGGLCLLFRFEQPEGVIRRQVGHFHRNLLPFFDMTAFTESEFVNDATQPPRDNSARGLMVISDIPTTPVEEIQNIALKIANSPHAKQFEERLVVFDSISAARGYGKDPDLWRTFLLESTGVLRALGYTVVFLVERNQREEVDFEDYVADLDIRLSQQRQDHSYLFRVLEITKSRWQPSHRGHHVYTIETGNGMQVYPSSAAVVAARRRRELRVRYGMNRPINPGVKNFGTYLGGTKADGKKDQDSVSWWMQGSVTALIGTRGSLKSPFAHLFSTTVDHDTGGITPCSLSLHFADEFQSSLGDRKRKDQRPTSFGVRYDIPIPDPDIPIGRDGLGPTLSYILFRSGYLASGHVLQTVRDVISEKRKTQTPIKRAVISDAGNLAPDFPALRNEPAFLPALCDLLTSEGITTVIVYSRPEHGAEDYVVDQVRSVAENIVRFELISHAGREYSSISVERSATSSHDHGVYEIRESQPGDPSGGIEVAPTFDLVVNLKTGSPKVAPVRIMLDAGTKLQYKYHSKLRKFYRSIGAYDVRVLDHAIAFGRQRGVQYVTLVESALWLIQVDSNELPDSTASSDLRNAVLCDLTQFNPEMLSLQKELVYSPAAQDGARRKHSDRQGVMSIPYYLNPSFLVVQREFRDFALSHKAWKKIGLGEGDYTWGELMEAAMEFRGTDVQWSDHILFDFPLSPSENLNCLFLEVLSSLSAGQWGWGHFRSIFGPDSLFLKDDGLLINAILILRQLAREPLEKYYSGDVKQPSDNVKNRDAGDAARRPFLSSSHLTSKAIIWRHWYSTFRQMAADIGQGKGQLNPGLTLLRLPGNVWTSGDWHLAILEGSVGVRQGIEIILDKFVNRPNGIELMTNGVGLPPFRDFYNDGSELLLTGVAPSWFSSYVQGSGVIYRSMLKDYKKIAPLLRYYLASIIREREGTGDDLKSKIRETFLSMHNKLDTLVP
jgi:KaiC/GvpD/RAD55 family RecA-like ATPase